MMVPFSKNRKKKMPSKDIDNVARIAMKLSNVAVMVNKRTRAGTKSLKRHPPLTVRPHRLYF